MKHKFLLMAIFLLTIGNMVYAQKVTLDFRQEKLGKVMEAISKQTGKSFSYSRPAINPDAKVSISVKDEELYTALARIIETDDVEIEITDKKIFLKPVQKRTSSTPTGGDQKQITGHISDTSGEAVIGASVVLKGSSTGTVSDVNGRFSISAPAGSTLVISYLGYLAQEIKLGDRSTLDIVLQEDVQALNEVVVVGYGSVKKANLTGAVASIGGERLENRSVPTLTQALQGTVANLNISIPNGAPGSKLDINIRGYTGIKIDDNGTKSNVSGSPLIVIDGVQGGDLSSINMNDVENISVLKDAASAAIYGSSAPFGVIIVTTKRGHSGKPVITYGNNFGFSRPTNLPSYVNSLDFALAFNEVGLQSTGTTTFSEPTLEKIRQYQAGQITAETEQDGANDAWKSWGASWANNDWFDIYFKKTSFSQQHNIGVSGASDALSYYIGLGYNQQDGLYKWADDSYHRYNLRSNVSSEITKWLTFNLRSAFSRAETDNPAPYNSSSVTGSSDYSYAMFHMLGKTWPTVPLKNPNGEYSDASNVNLFTQAGRLKETTDNAVLTGEFVISPLAGWDITTNYTYDGTYIDNSTHTKTIFLTPPSGTSAAKSGTTPNGITRNAYKNQHHTVNVFSSYEKTISDHYFKVLAGYTQEAYDDFRFWSSNDNLYTDEIPMLSMTYGTNRSINDSQSQLAIRGVFGRINYNYQEKYLLELNSRYDGTSRFMKDVRYKFYPGVSAAWVPSKESFWEPIQEYVNHLKIRASYASLGDQSFSSSRYPFYPSLGTNVPTSTRWLFSGGRESSVWMPGLVNYDLTWITTNTLSVGFDAALLRNRLTFSFDWYQRNAKDFADYGEKLPALLGTSAPRMNSAETETKGFEITAGWRDKIGDVKYNAGVVLSDYTGKVLKYNNPTKLIDDMWYDGMTMGEIWGYETVGLFKDQAEIDATDQSYLRAKEDWRVGDVHYKDLNNDGKIDRGDNTVDNPGDRKIIGNSTPRYSFGINLGAEWKGLDLAVFLQGVGKRDIMFASNANYFWGFTTTGQSTYFTAHTDRWTEKNPDGYLPRAYFNTDKNRQAQTRYLQDASYLRLKNIQLGYTLPATLTDKIKLQKARIFVNAENLATFTNLSKIIDPEIVNSDAKVYPIQGTWAFGINVTF